MGTPRLLGVLLCYNDGDILADNIRHLLSNGHDLVIWDHGSTDETADVLQQFRSDLREATFISRAAVDFYDMYPLMSKHLLDKYVREYEWISWPDQDEILEGPDRARTYQQWLEEAIDSKSNYIRFEDYVYWHTEQDDADVESPVDRVRYYSRSIVGPAKIRSWRARATNIRWFNHNVLQGEAYPVRFNLRHYPMRSRAQMARRLQVDRANLKRGPLNCHYENMKTHLEALDVRAERLHHDDRASELNPAPVFDWEGIYGRPPELPAPVALAFTVSTRRWQFAADLMKALRIWRGARAWAPHFKRRMALWIQALTDAPELPILISLDAECPGIISADLARDWDAGIVPTRSPASGSVHTADLAVGDRRLTITLDVAARRLTVDMASGTSPLLLALVPVGTHDSPRLTTTEQPMVFADLTSSRYALSLEPSADVESRPESVAVEIDGRV